MFEDDIALYVVGIDPVETMPVLQSYRQNRKYSWAFVLPGPNMLESLGVFQQSTKIIFDKSGIIKYRKGYGQGYPDGWEPLFQSLIVTD